jgi:hypothetical protein
LAGIPVGAKSLSVGQAIYGSSDSPDVKYAEMKSPEAMKDVLLVLHLAFQCFPPLHFWPWAIDSRELHCYCSNICSLPPAEECDRRLEKRNDLSCSE